MRVLQIEDDGATAQGVELMLKSEGMVVFTTDLGEEGADLAKVYEYDLILLDLNLPDINGMDVLRTIRACKVMTPVLVVSGTSDVSKKVQALTLGADDYLQKPFHKDELVARIHAIVRRSKGHAQSALSLGNLTVDLMQKRVRVGATSVHLTGKEYGFLEALALRPGHTLTKEAVMTHLYNGMDEPEIKIVDVFACKLRKKLREAGCDAGIVTTWGRGYMLAGPEQMKAAA